MRFVREHKLTDKKETRVGTKSGVIVPKLEADGQVTVDMGVPVFDPPRIPFTAERRAPTYMLEIGNRTVEISALSMGNPHAVQVVADVAVAPVTSEGAAVEAHPRFPQRVNAGYMQVVDRGHIKLRVYERGAGETLACGSGACAAVAAGILRGLLDQRVMVATRGGDLGISWQGEGTPVLMTGPAITVFEGELEIELGI
jgi:diaminopimelate epimerase